MSKQLERKSTKLIEVEWCAVEGGSHNPPIQFFHWRLISFLLFLNQQTTQLFLPFNQRSWLNERKRVVCFLLLVDLLVMSRRLLCRHWIPFHSFFQKNSISSMLAIQNQMKRRKDSLVGVDKEKVNWLRKEKVEWVDGQRKTHNQSLRHLLKAIEQPSNPSINFHFLNQQKENLTFLFWFRQFNYDWSGGIEKDIITVC